MKRHFTNEETHKINKYGITSVRMGSAQFFSTVFFFFFFNLFMAVLGLRFCARAFCSCGKREPLFITARGPLTVAASLVAEHRLQMRRLSSCGSRPQLLRGMWDLPRPGLEPVSPALTGGFLTTAPPGKPSTLFCIHTLVQLLQETVWHDLVKLQKWSLSMSTRKYVQ